MGKMSSSSTSRTPPGRTVAARRRSTRSRSGMWTSTRRVWTRVEGVPGQLVGDEVQPADLQAGRRCMLQQAHVEVHGDHAAGVADPPGEPAGERAAARAGVEAVPAPADAERLRAADARRVVTRLEQRKPAPRLLPRVRRRVARLAEAARPCLRCAQGVLLRRGGDLPRWTTSVPACFRRCAASRALPPRTRRPAARPRRSPAARGRSRAPGAGPPAASSRAPSPRSAGPSTPGSRRPPRI